MSDRMYDLILNDVDYLRLKFILLSFVVLFDKSFSQAQLMEALKHGMLMQRELSAISAQLKHFQGLSYIYYGCNSLLPWCLLLTSFWCCSVLDLKCSPVEPIFVSAAASKGYFLLIVLNVCMEVLKYDILQSPGDLFNNTSTRSMMLLLYQ